MNKYSVFVSGRVSKEYEIDADTKEDAMVEALTYFNEQTTNGYEENNIISEVFTNAEELSIEDTKEENATEE